MKCMIQVRESALRSLVLEKQQTLRQLTVVHMCTPSNDETCYPWHSSLSDMQALTASALALQQIYACNLCETDTTAAGTETNGKAKSRSARRRRNVLDG